MLLPLQRCPSCIAFPCVFTCCTTSSQPPPAPPTSLIVSALYFPMSRAGRRCDEGVIVTLFLSCGIADEARGALPSALLHLVDYNSLCLANKFQQDIGLRSRPSVSLKYKQSSLLQWWWCCGYGPSHSSSLLSLWGSPWLT